MGLDTATESGAAASQKDQVTLVPFVRASHRPVEPAFDTSQLMDSTQITLGPFDIPARGFLRDILLYVTASGGVIGTGVLDADAPWSVIGKVELIDTNGAALVDPLTGYQLFLANIVGAYRGYPDPTVSPEYSATINPAFMLRVPAEVTPWDGFGSLQNQSASAPFRIRITLGQDTDLLSTVGTATVPTIRIRGFVEEYSQPPALDIYGQPSETAPPGHGAVQHWSVATPVVAASLLAVRLTRVGNLIRNLIFVHRDTSGDRSAVVEPDEISFTWDSAAVYSSIPVEVLRRWAREAFGYDLPTGVIAFPYTDDQDGSAGFESRHLYLPTSGSTRLEYTGTFGAAGVLEIITNDLTVTKLGV